MTFLKIKENNLANKEMNQNKDGNGRVKVKRTSVLD